MADACVMDNDPSQTSKESQKTLDEVEAEFHRIPARSPDLNPIENIFHIVKNYLEQETIASNITSETFEQFKERVLRIMNNISVSLVDKTIASLPRRIEAVLEGKGHRTKY